MFGSIEFEELICPILQTIFFLSFHQENHNLVMEFQGELGVPGFNTHIEKKNIFPNS